MDDRQLELKEACAIPRQFWVPPKTSMLLSCPLYSTLFRSKREPRHFTFIFLSLFFRRQHGDRRREGAILLNVHHAGHAEGGASRDHRDDLQ